MKKLLIILTVFIIFITIFVTLDNKSKYKIIKINSPISFYIDENKNSILDEKSPVYINNIYFVELKSDYTNNSILKELEPKEKLFLEYFAKLYSKNIIYNKYVKIQNGEITVNGKPYKQLLTDTGYFYNDDKDSQLALVRKIKSENLDDYVIYNSKSKKYHNFNCPEIFKLKNYKIIKKSQIDNNFIPCKNCILPKDIKENPPEQKTLQTDNQVFNNNIKVFFIDLNETFKPSDKCLTKVCRVLKDEINNAKNTIDIALYGIDAQPEILNAIINAQKRGVKVRIVSDFNKETDNYYADTLKLKSKIKNFITDKDYDLNNFPAIMHNKFFIFDNKKVFTGSTNISKTGITGFNSNISILINSADAAKIFTKEFEQMFNGNFHKQKKKINNQEIVFNDELKLKILFSPQDKIITNHIIPLIKNAKKYVYIPVFYLTKIELINALETAHKNNADIKIILDSTGAHNKYSIHKQLRQKGIKVKTENYAGKMHTKAIFIDDKYSVIGSMNYTNSGENRNDENVIIIQNKEITEFLRNSFISLWNKIPPKYENYDPKAESIESIGSCYDGIDNDFDKKIDKEDDYCTIK